MKKSPQSLQLAAAIALSVLVLTGRTAQAQFRVSKIAASDAAHNAYFGRDVAIAGNYAIIGAAGDDDGGDGAGAAYIFRRIDSTWTEHVKLQAGNQRSDDDFGAAVDTHGD